mmetsp:Transcript_17945/g.23616  ORF Transcript_17945/g.23616 Transcript_17945/m.23616 type:complete len:464 (-) Transcript_17945:196-1587(-)
MHSVSGIFKDLAWKRKNGTEATKRSNFRMILLPDDKVEFACESWLAQSWQNGLSWNHVSFNRTFELWNALASSVAAACEGEEAPSDAAYSVDKINSFQKDTTKSWYFYSGPPKDPRSLNRVKIFAGSMGTEMTSDVAKLLNMKTGRVALGQYKDGEISVHIEENIRGKDVFVVAPAFTQDSWMELFLLVSAARRASAKQITVVVPFFGYARLDQRVKREPIAAADMARMLEEMGVDHLVSVDFHTMQLAGFFQPKISADNIEPWGVAAGYFIEQLEEMKADKPLKVVVVASHENHMRRATSLRDLIVRYSAGRQDLDVQVAAISKMRTREDHHRGIHRQLIGQVEGSICIVVDDLCDTGTTITEAADLLKESGADKVWAFATHGRFSAGGAEKVTASTTLDYLVCTDTIPFHRFISKDVLNVGKIRQLSMAPIIAESIHRMHDKRNIDALLYPTKYATTKESS